MATKQIAKTKKSEHVAQAATSPAVRPLSAVSLLLSVVQTLFILALVGLSIATFGARIPTLANMGLQFFAVTSGSMEPAIPTGALISVGGYELEGLSSGDVITYVLQEGSEPSVVTHRIHEVIRQEITQQREVEGEVVERAVVTYEFMTKGDANSQPDPYTIGPNDIIGLYNWHVPHVGYITSYAQTARGFVMLVIVPAFILIVWEIITLVLYFKNKYQTSAQHELAELKKQLQERTTGDAKHKK